MADGILEKPERTFEAYDGIPSGPLPAFICPICESAMFTAGPGRAGVIAFRFYCTLNGHTFALESELKAAPVKDAPDPFPGPISGPGGSF